VPKDTFIDHLPISYFIEIEVQKVISKMFQMLSETEETIFKKIKPFINDDDRQNLIKNYEEES